MLPCILKVVTKDRKRDITFFRASKVSSIFICLGENCYNPRFYVVWILSDYIMPLKIDRPRDVLIIKIRFGSVNRTYLLDLYLSSFCIYHVESEKYNNPDAYNC